VSETVNNTIFVLFAQPLYNTTLFWKTEYQIPEPILVCTVSQYT